MNEINIGVFEADKDDNIYIIGDIHGDYQCFVHCLVDLCNSCDIVEIYEDSEFKTQNREKLQWKKNNKSIVIFCGDLIDRKRFKNVLDDECSDIYILKTLIRLRKDAIKNGGNVIIISGNHEIMNIVNTDNNLYISPLNKNSNDKYFKDPKFIKEYILNSYAWIKINDILIAHGGLCSDYLNFLNKKIKKIEIVNYVNIEYRNFFIEMNEHKNIQEKSIEDMKDKHIIPYNLFINYDLEHKTKHNIFWCREWGYGKIDCKKLEEILEQVNCKKMIISHCPQFLSPDKPKMINFECLDQNKKYLLARIDLGMSRSFDYNKDDDDENDDKFFHYLSNNYNRKMSILKLLHNDENNLYFDISGVITQKLSCIQYLLLKYGITQKEWNKKKIKSNWIGFSHINKLLKSNENNEDYKESTICKNINNNMNTNCILLCLLYQVCMKNSDLNSVKQFNQLIK